jgi:hypothetical protein
MRFGAEHRLGWAWTSALLAAALLVPSGAQAKPGCEHQGPRGGVVLDGVPRHPVAKRTYIVDAFVPGGRMYTIYGAPKLGIFNCAGPVFDPGGPPVTNWIQPDERLSADPRAGRYSFRLRFPRPGRWELGIVDRRGRARDLGVREVGRGPAEAQPDTGLGPEPPGGGDRSLAAAAIGAGVLALATSAVALRSRRRRGA